MRSYQEIEQRIKAVERFTYRRFDDLLPPDQEAFCLQNLAGLRIALNCYSALDFESLTNIVKATVRENGLQEAFLWVAGNVEYVSDATDPDNVFFDGCPF